MDELEKALITIREECKKKMICVFPVDFIHPMVSVV